MEYSISVFYLEGIRQIFFPQIIQTVKLANILHHTVITLRPVNSSINKVSNSIQKLHATSLKLEDTDDG